MCSSDLCVKHAASVRPEPGSNSPKRFDLAKNVTSFSYSLYTKGISPRDRNHGRGKLALTCGTLLSSQGTGAHQSQSFDRFWGNPPNLTTWIRGVKLTACRSILLSCQTSDLEFTDRPYLLSVSQWRPNFSRTSGNESNRPCFCRKCPEFPLTKSRYWEFLLNENCSNFSFSSAQN